MITKIAFVALTALTCPKTAIDNKTGLWNEQDQKALETATKHCSEMYLSSPCLKMFRKVEQGIYSALCAAPISRK